MGTFFCQTSVPCGWCAWCQYEAADLELKRALRKVLASLPAQHGCASDRPAGGPIPGPREDLVALLNGAMGHFGVTIERVSKGGFVVGYDRPTPSAVVNALARIASVLDSVTGLPGGAA